jgi:hypothetical protein
MKSNEDKFKFMQLRAHGKSYDNISKFLGISKPTLLSWGKEFVEEINELKREVFEQQLEQCGLTLIKKMQLYKKRFDALEEEIDIRGLRMRDYKDLVEYENKYLKSFAHTYRTFLYPSGWKNVTKGEKNLEDKKQQVDRTEEENKDTK